MSSYKYRITVEPVAEEQNSAKQDNQPLSFEVETHDDIISIVNRLRCRTDLDPDFAESFGVGLKLFGEVMLKNRTNALFEPLIPHFKEFMTRLKQK